MNPEYFLDNGNEGIMKTRKDMKRQAVACLKKHYFIFVAVCLISAYLGSEFSLSIRRLGIGVNPLDNVYTVNMGGLVVHQGLSDVVDKALQGQISEGRELSRQIRQQAIDDSKDDHPSFARTKGVLAGIINDISSGSIFVTLIAAVHSLLGSADVTMNIFIVLSFFMPLMLWFFLQNMFIVVSRRMFLEGRCYKKVPIRRFLFLFSVRRWLKTCWTMAVVSVFEILWALTIVGIFVKYYSYYLVPYILAENPDIGTLEAISLSRKMMVGHKWQCFVFELSFLGWDLLGLVTLGITDLLFASPYKVASFCEYYVELRHLAKAQEVENAWKLNDVYLYQTASPQDIAFAYGDVLKILKRPVEDLSEFTGFRGFLMRWFGVLLMYTKRERAYEEGQARLQRIAALREAADGEVYPSRLFPLPERAGIRIEPLRYIRNYSMASLVLMFFIFSMFGWLWEVCLHMVNHGVFVNRGVLHGPWLPIYGSGAVLILVLLKRLRAHPVKEFFAILFLCGFVEYMTSWVLEGLTGGKRWWDYTGYFLNLHGRICAEGLLVFGIGGMIVVYVAAPILDSVLRRIRRKVMVPLCIGLLCLFFGDLAWSAITPNTGTGITAPQIVTVRGEQYPQITTEKGSF